MPELLKNASSIPAFDPARHPERYEGVLIRRVLAFVIDAVLMGILYLIGWFLVFILGFFTLGLGWLLFALMAPLVIFGYAAFTLGLRSRTVGMGLLGLEMRLTDGAPIPMTIAMGHAVLFYIVCVIFTPIVLIIGLFNQKRRLPHDMILNMVLINDAMKASFTSKVRTRKKCCALAFTAFYDLFSLYTTPFPLIRLLDNHRMA